MLEHGSVTRSFRCLQMQVFEQTTGMIVERGPSQSFEECRFLYFNSHMQASLYVDGKRGPALGQENG